MVSECRLHWQASAWLIFDTLPPPLKHHIPFYAQTASFDFLCFVLSYVLFILLYSTFSFRDSTPHVRVRITPYLLYCLQDEGDYLCVKVLRHSKSKKTMVSPNLSEPVATDAALLSLLSNAVVGERSRRDTVAVEQRILVPCWLARVGCYSP